MTRSLDHDEEDLNPAQTQVVRRLRRLMVFSSLIMIVGFLVVFGVIAYRLSTAPEAPKMPEANVRLPAGAHIMSTAVAGDKLVVTIDVAGTTEVRFYDLATLAPRGRMTFEHEP